MLRPSLPNKHPLPGRQGLSPNYFLLDLIAAEHPDEVDDVVDDEKNRNIQEGHVIWNAKLRSSRTSESPCSARRPKEQRVLK